MYLKNYTEVICLIDRSGSMANIREETLSGFNNFLKEQKEIVNEDKISLYLFDDQYDIIYENLSIQDAPEFTKEVFVPRGWTSLYDAMGKTINSVGERLANLPEKERPEKVLFVIITDGVENTSKEFKKEAIREMVTHQTNVYKWQFLFLAANQDAFLGADSIGTKNGYQFSTKVGSTTNMLNTNAMAVKSLRSMDILTYDRSFASSDLYTTLNLSKDADKDTLNP